MISRGQDKQLGKDGMGRGEVEADEEKKNGFNETHKDGARPTPAPREAMSLMTNTSSPHQEERR